MKNKHLILVFFTIAVLLAPHDRASAQNISFGGGATLSALHPATNLGAGSIAGAGVKAELGLSSRISIGLSSTWYLDAATESPMTDHGRVYDLFIPALHFRASLIGENTNLAALLDVAALRYQLEAHGGDVARRTTVPALGAGLGLRVHLLGPMYLDIEGRDWITYVKPNYLGSAPGGMREIAHSPDLRVSLSFLLRKQEPTLASFQDLPLSYIRDFRPINASDIRTRPSPVNDHTHGEYGAENPIQESQNNFTETQADSSTSPSADKGSVAILPKTASHWLEHKLGTIYFALGSHEVDTKYRSLLADVANYLKSQPDVRLALHGYTDSSGSIRLNLSLAERRGTTVQELLTRLYGVEASRIEVISKGIDFTASQANHARRVDLIALIPK